MSIPADNKVTMAGFARLEYRRFVLDHAELPISWRNLDWLDHAACRYMLAPDHGMCEACPVSKECLGAALLVDDPARLRGGLTWPERVDLWSALEAIAQQQEPWIGQLPQAAIW